MTYNYNNLVIVQPSRFRIVLFLIKIYAMDIDISSEQLPL